MNKEATREMLKVAAELGAATEPVEVVEVEVLPEVEEEPVEEAPVEEAPVEEAPVEEAPVEEAPVEEAPVEEAPVEEAPVEEAPVEEAPVVEEVPGDPEGFVAFILGTPFCEHRGFVVDDGGSHVVMGAVTS